MKEDPNYHSKATYSSLSVSINVDTMPPSLVLSLPENITYTTTTILLNFSINDSFSSIGTIWYNLDSGANITITDNITFTASDGIHTLRLYANDSVGLVNDSNQVVFTVSTQAPAPSQSAISGGSGGGGRGAVAALPVTPTIKEVPDPISISDKVIKLKTFAGGTVDHYIIFTNNGKETIKIKIDLTNVAKFISTSGLFKEEFEIEPGEIKEYKIAIRTDKNLKPELYTEKIKISYLDEVKQIPFILEVSSPEPLFDVVLKIFNNTLSSGSKLIFETTITNIKTITGQTDVNITYYIRDLENNQIIEESEARIFEMQINYIKTIKLPDYIKDGTYLLYIKVSSGNVVSSASDVFYVKSKQDFFSYLNKNFMIYVLFIILLLVIFFVESSQMKKLKKLEQFFDLGIKTYKERQLGIVKNTQNSISSENNLQSNIRSQIARRAIMLRDNYASGNISKEYYDSSMRKLREFVYKIELPNRSKL
ncbi:hypothetical protein HYU23_01080 [Candidatus Woesearchaeota archaeon]|nr:hypothetical protein [Candidatus Woesearchaeota archaeon]